MGWSLKRHDALLLVQRCSMVFCRVAEPHALLSSMSASRVVVQCAHCAATVNTALLLKTLLHSPPPRCYPPPQRATTSSTSGTLQEWYR
eukprot:scaffold74418_cov18-Tisochrysis_lutea.AAC.3